MQNIKGDFVPVEETVELVIIKDLSRGRKSSVCEKPKISPVLRDNVSAKREPAQAKIKNNVEIAILKNFEFIELLYDESLEKALDFNYQREQLIKILQE